VTDHLILLNFNCGLL